MARRLAFILICLFITSCSNPQPTTPTVKVITPQPSETKILLTTTPTATETQKPTATATTTATATSTVEPTKAPKTPEDIFKSNMERWHEINPLVDINKLEKRADGKYYVPKTKFMAFDPKTDRYGYDFIFNVARDTCETPNPKIDYKPGQNMPLSLDKMSAYIDSFVPKSIGLSAYPIMPGPCWVAGDDTFFNWKDTSGHVNRIATANIENRLDFQGNWNP